MGGDIQGVGLQQENTTPGTCLAWLLVCWSRGRLASLGSEKDHSDMDFTLVMAAHELDTDLESDVTGDDNDDGGHT